MNAVSNQKELFEEFKHRCEAAGLTSSCSEDERHEILQQVGKGLREDYSELIETLDKSALSEDELDEIAGGNLFYDAQESFWDAVKPW